MLTPTSSGPTFKVAIYRTSSLGDVVLATACLDLLASLTLPTEIYWIGRSSSLEMITQSWPQVKGIEVAPSQPITSLQSIIDQLAGVHVLIDLQVNLRSRWLSRNLKLNHGVPFFTAPKAQLQRSRMIIEGRLRGRRRPLPAKVVHPDILQFRVMTNVLREALRQHLPVEMRDGVENSDFRPRLPIPDHFDPPWRKELRFGIWLGIAPGAAYQTKQAPISIIAKIIEHIRTLATSNKNLSPIGSHTPPLGLVFFGDSRDRETARMIIDAIGWNGPLLNLAGRLSLWESAVALSETTTLLTNDTSLSHIAEAVNTPTSVLFGPTVEAFGFAPRMERSRAFSTMIGCRPCSKHGKLGCRFEDKLCFTTLDTETISHHIMALLVSPESKPPRRILGASGKSSPRDLGVQNASTLEKGQIRGQLGAMWDAWAGEADQPSTTNDSLPVAPL